MSINPFDPKTVFLAKHAQHVVLIHFPIALFLVGVGFDVAARWTRSRTLATAAYLNLWVAAVSTLPVVATGIIAWRWALEGQPLKGVLLLHLLLGWISTILLWITVWLHRRSRNLNKEEMSGVSLLVELLGVLAITLTGHLGGFLSGVNMPS